METDERRIYAPGAMKADRPADIRNRDRIEQAWREARDRESVGMDVVERWGLERRAQPTTLGQGWDLRARRRGAYLCLDEATDASKCRRIRLEQ